MVQPLDTAASAPGLSAAGALGATLVDQVSGIVLDADAPIRLAVAALLAGGHVLVEDRPGVGKTVLAKALARSIGGTFGRVQGTADLLPTDITGVSVFDQGDQDWMFRPGPLFHNVVLVDEVNRATPRAQSALLEAMAEGQVTVDGVEHRLPEPFLVIATQNPVGDAGTFTLVEGQRDRFAVTVSLGLPGRTAERALVLGEGGAAALGQLNAVAGPVELIRARRDIDRVRVAGAVADYVLDLVEGTRRHPEVTLGASPRASQVLVRVARCWATLDGRSFVQPDDVKAVATAVLAHRLVLRDRGSTAQARKVVDEVVASARPPIP